MHSRAKYGALLHRAILGCAVAMTACSDAFGPAKDLTVVLTAPNIRTQIGETAEGAVISCEFDVDARGTGRADATMLGAVLRMYAGPTRTAPFDTARFGTDVLLLAYETLLIPPDFTKSATLSASLSVPFELEYELEYTVNGRNKSAKVRMPCGPALPAGGVQAPVIAPIVVGGKDALSPGDPITIPLSVTSNYGMWETWVWIDGPFADSVHYLERGAPNVERVASFIVPAGARPDVPITVTVALLDAAGGVSVREVTSPKHVADIAPPLLTSARFKYRDSWSSDDIGPQLSFGNVLGFELDASDDLGLRWIVLATDGPTPTSDSIAVVNGIAASEGFAFNPQWVGARTVSLHVVDRAGKRSVNTISSPVDSLNFYRYVARPMKSLTFASSGQPAHDVARNRIYVPSGSRILVVDAATMSQLSPIELGVYVTGLDMSISGDSIVAASPGWAELAIVDLRGPAPIVSHRPVFATPVGGGAPVSVEPGDVKIDMNGRWIVTAGRGPVNVVLGLDPVTGIGTWLTRPADVADGSEGLNARLSRSADRSRMVVQYTGCPRTYDAATQVLGACAGLASSWWTSAVAMISPNGNEITSDRVFYDRDLVPRDRTWARSAAATTIAYDADGTTLWVAEGAFLDRVRASDGRRLERTVTGVDPANIWSSADGNFVFVFASWGTGLVRIDLR